MMKYESKVKLLESACVLMNNEGFRGCYFGHESERFYDAVRLVERATDLIKKDSQPLKKCENDKEE